MLGAASGDRSLAPAGGMILKDLSEGPDRQMKALLHREQATKLHESNTAMADPATAAAQRAMLAEMLPGVDFSKASPQAMATLLPVAAGLAKSREGADARRDTAETNATVRRGMGQALADERKSKQEAKDTKSLEERFTKFGQELDPTKARGGEMAKAVNLQLQADRLLKLVEDDPNPNSQKIYELARGMDRLVSGASPTIGATSHLVPQSALGSINDFAQWLKNAPQGRDQQAFVKQMVDTIMRERGVVSGAVREWQGKKASRFSDLAGKDKARYLAELQNWGLDESEFDPATWAYKGKPKAVPAAATAAQAAPSGRPQRTDPATGETREWDGKAWVVP